MQQIFNNQIAQVLCYLVFAGVWSVVAEIATQTTSDYKYRVGSWALGTLFGFKDSLKDLFNSIFKGKSEEEINEYYQEIGGDAAVA